jgi:uncharacterized NAD-dependent epimerase/dehydratase family protein
MGNVNVALLDSGIELTHRSFAGWTVPQYVYNGTKWEEKIYEPQHGHGTGVGSIIVNNAESFLLTSFVLFEQKLTVAIDRYVSALEKILDSNVHYDIIHMSLGVRYYNKRLEELCIQLGEKGTLIVAAFDNIGSISYPAALSTVIGVDASFRCFKKDEFVFVGRDGIVNLKAKAGNQRIAWLNNTYIITQGTSFAAAYVTAQCVKLLQDGLSNSDILSWFKDVYPERQAVKKTNQTGNFLINKAVVFPFNKEVTSMLRFSDLLNFELLDVYDTSRSGKIGQKIYDFNGDICYTVKNIEECPWNNFDALILGHTYDLEYFSNEKIRDKLLQMCIKNKINVYSFDDEMINRTTIEDFENAGLKIYFPTVSFDDMPQKMGKMFTIKSPVLGILGTSSQQGKFTLQLHLRRRFLQDSYSIGQLGSEPESLLFGMDHVYPFGFRSTITMDYIKSIEYLNARIADIDKMGNDIIMAGSQTGTWPMLYHHINNYVLDRLCFLLGTKPDAVILCINYHDKPEDIKRVITGIEALVKAKVIACSLFPLGFKDEWEMTRGVKTPIETKNLAQYCKHIQDITAVPCYVLDEKTGPDSMYRECINFFAKK